MKGILLSVIVENISTRKDRTLKITLGSQEVSQGQAGEIFTLMNNLAAVYICQKDNISQKEIEQVDRLDPELQGKTQSQRLRNVLYKLFEQSPEGFQSFDTFYKSKTETIIEHYKAKIQ